MIVQVLRIGDVEDVRTPEELKLRPWGGSEKPHVAKEDWTEEQIAELREKQPTPDYTDIIKDVPDALIEAEVRRRAFLKTGHVTLEGK